MNYDPLEVARIIGEPKDPRRPYPKLVSSLCETDTADPEEYLYYFDCLVNTEKVIVITASGAVTQENITPDTPVQISFTDLATPEYYVKITDYSRRKEQVLARYNMTINRALNSYETYKVVTMLDACIDSGAVAPNVSSYTGQDFTLGSGYTRFSFPHVIDMLEAVQDYGDNYTLVTGSQCAKDIKLWNWNDNKYQSVSQAWDDLNIEEVRISLAGSAATFNYDDDGSGGTVSTDILANNKAFLVAKDTELGKPLLFVRKNLDSVKALGGIVSENGEMPERLVFVSPNPITVTGTARYLAVGITGYEQIAGAVKNPLAVARFTRS